jgi:putative nucleotidyltransferase with HDIG domain
MNDEKIPKELDDRLVAFIGSNRIRVPPYPAIALRIGNLLKRADYSLGELTSLVTSDQALSAAVLRAANSARMRGTWQIQSLTEAVSRVGSNELVRLAFTVGLGQEASKDGVLLDLRRMVWRQSIWSAFLCRELASRWQLDPDAAFLCGLLHDFGRVITLACLEEIQAAAGATIRLSPIRCCQVMEAYHVELGMVMAEKWDLPNMVADVIREHHYVPGSITRDYVELVRVTDQVVLMMESSLIVERGQLDSIASLISVERDFIHELMPGLPGLVEGLDPQGGAPLPKMSLYMALDADAGDSGEDILNHIDMEATCRVFGDDTRCNLIGISPRRLQLLSTRMYAPQTVVQLIVDGSDGPFRMWCTLTSIRQQTRRHGVRYVAEIRPFALTATAKLGWTQLLAASTPPAVPAPAARA